MIQLIFPYDSIDDGRKKINSTFFSGYTPSGYWKSLNSGTTGFSLEFTASTAGISSNNSDTSSDSNNIIVGNNNSIIGTGGHNFIKGKNNLVKNCNFNYIDGELNYLTGITKSFIYSRGIQLSTSTNTAIINTHSLIFNPNFNLNNSTLINLVGEFYSDSGLSLNNYLLGISSKVFITGKTNYLSCLNGREYSISGDVKNSFIAGAYNNIGHKYSVASNGAHDNIFIFGSGITPSLSATSITSLSGTYINSLCIEDKLIFNKKNASPPMLSTVVTTDFDKYNLYKVDNAIGNDLTATSKTLSNLFHSSTTGSGMFFITYFDSSGSFGGSFSGQSISFVDNYGYNNKIDMQSNLYSANTAFYGYSHNLKKYIKYRG